MDSPADENLRRKLRQAIDAAFPDDSAFNAFVLDYFPDVFRQYNSSQDRTARVNLLLISDLRLNEIIVAIDNLNRQNTRTSTQPTNFTSKPLLSLSDSFDTIADGVSRQTGGQLVAVTSTGAVSVLKSGRQRPKYYLVLAMPVLVFAAFCAGYAMIHNLPKSGAHIITDSPIQTLHHLSGCILLREATYLEKIDRLRDGQIHCNADEIIDLLSNDIYLNKFKSSYTPRLYTMLNLLVAFDRRNESSVKRILHEKCYLKNSPSSWIACLKLGGLEISNHRGAEEQTETCLAYRKACELNEGIGCLALFSPEGKPMAACRRAYTEAKRRQILDSVCTKEQYPFACYSLGRIYSSEDQFCDAARYYWKACQLAKKNEAYCSNIYNEFEFDPISLDCDISGRKSCDALIDMSHFGQLSACTDITYQVNDASNKVRAISSE